MQKVNITELRNHLPKYLARSKAGETLEITSRGKVVALLAPPKEHCADSASRALEKLRSQCKVGDVVSPVDEPWDALQ